MPAHVKADEDATYELPFHRSLWGAHGGTLSWRTFEHPKPSAWQQEACQSAPLVRRHMASTWAAAAGQVPDWCHNCKEPSICEQALPTRVEAGGGVIYRVRSRT